MLNYNNTTGMSFGLIAQAFYKMNKQDTISPTSSSGILGIVTTNGTYFTSLFQRMYLNEDRWRILLAAGLGNINYQYWQEFTQNSGAFIGFNTAANFGLARVERQVYNKLYAGVKGIYSVAETDFDLPDFFPDDMKNQRINMNSVGYLLNFDKREHQINPHGGYNIEFKNNFYREWIGSGANFESYELSYNHYYKINNERNILATRVHTSISTGDVPFQGQNVVGRDDIRGYSEGKYRADQVYAIQAEYRWRFYNKLGMVGFVGLATAANSFSDILDETLLPGAGVGIRYLMIPKERINIGIDIAQGKDDWGLYFRIGESFGR
jgi:outer membrane translocation and assembly module TamA